jgi:hypothetical protein
MRSTKVCCSESLKLMVESRTDCFYISDDDEYDDEASADDVPPVDDVDDGKRPKRTAPLSKKAGSANSEIFGFGNSLTVKGLSRSNHP